MSLTYTNHAYFQGDYPEGDDFHYDVNRADMPLLGVEVCF